ncbi:hypothetical protein EG68_00064 [Paragonimus skrjabini miyazakii]|uniref:Uncharacterized protein n=1 Tax=Paragonimus skrjabini miyazakii TaxID=59628 RepID=A0A8S9Z9U9_9TREM|nr:hypothetical protein EG68_00064 [Paragonimus skrjabini miyazakii]
MFPLANFNCDQNAEEQFYGLRLRSVNLLRIGFTLARQADPQKQQPPTPQRQCRLRRQLHLKHLRIVLEAVASMLVYYGWRISSHQYSVHTLGNEEKSALG